MLNSPTSRTCEPTVFTTITAITGVILGLSSLILSFLNFRRDRPKLLVSLRWDAITVCDQEGREATYGQIYLTNSGRRPIYVTAAGIEYDPPNASWYRRTQLQGRVKGRKLAEGDPPLSLVINATEPGLELLRDRCRYWREFRAFAEDSTGKRYYSEKTSQRPSWGEGDGCVPKRLTDAGYILECDLEQHQLESFLISGDWVLVPYDELLDRENLLRKYGRPVPERKPPHEGTRLVTFIGRTGRPSDPPL
jgi:hypothetical protein